MYRIHDTVQYNQMAEWTDSLFLKIFNDAEDKILEES